MAAYTNLGCPALVQELLKEQNTLAALSKQQNQAATGDAVGVFLIGIPASSTFGGDKEGQVAVSKGKVNAIISAIMSKGCMWGGVVRRHHRTADPPRHIRMQIAQD